MLAPALWIALFAGATPADVGHAAPSHEWPQAWQIAATIDELTVEHWRSAGIEPAGLTDDAAFLRRLTLDLAGRVPTLAETRAFLDSSSPHKRRGAIRRLMSSPGFALHWGNVLDDMLQSKYAGDASFVTYLRSSVAERKGWDQIFRELMLGPWDGEATEPAEQFLGKRIADLDEMTNDASRVFFGVDISCAKCHDHPEVDDWKQDHYYGMASFFNRSYLFRGEEQHVGEKESGDVEYVTRAGEERTAKVMFLSGRAIDEPQLDDDPDYKRRLDEAKKAKRYVAPRHSRRAELVRVALDDRQFFSRAIVNRVWANLLGRGLVDPVDQMHSANPPSIEGVLEFLADDFARHGYDLQRVIAGITASRVYQLSSRWTGDGDRPYASHFAVAMVRPLSPKQYVMSVALVADGGPDDERAGLQVLARRYEELERPMNPLVEYVDRPTFEFQSSVTEALFMSNNPEMQRLFDPDERNLVGHLASLDDAEELIETVTWAILSRDPTGDERRYLAEWLDGHGADRATACRDLAWALCTSAEFRFNH